MFCMILWVASAAATTVRPPPPACERAPAHAQPADAFYRLGIAGEPDLFLPGELYTVSLQGVDSGQGPTPFVGFTVWAEIDEESAKIDNTNSSKSLGAFQAYDAQTKPHDFCVPAVDNATAHPKTDIQIIWSAPLYAAEACVRLCARAAPVGGGEGQGAVLARKICGAPAAPASFARQPPILEPCCACDEAKYEVTFEGLWSRNTHPHEFPPESAQAHFGDVIGASHTAQYRVWQEGRVASAGLRRLAEDGATTALEKELKSEAYLNMSGIRYAPRCTCPTLNPNSTQTQPKLNSNSPQPQPTLKYIAYNFESLCNVQSDHIRTIIKARGISWQQVGGSGTPNTFAVFRVDARNHLVSLAAKLSPSPDWIVGVSALELCNANCTWSASATLPLYPYDAGTDSGITYVSRRQPTLPPAPVRALRPDWPKDARSPFFSANGDMRPFARLRLTRLQLFEKNCDASKSGSDSSAEHAGSGGACATHSWGAWGACSVSCGEGRAARQRQYVWPARARAEACRVPLTDYTRCHGPRQHCRAISEYEPEASTSTGPCALSAWSAWSACEGCGVRARTRHYLAPRARKRCHVGYRARAPTSQAMPCDAGPCHKPAKFTNATNHDWFFVDQPSYPCKVTPWGDWSPCSSRCGRGRRLRTRLYLAQDTRAQPELSHRLLHQWNKRFAELQKLDFPSENLTAADPEIEKLVQEQLDKCQFTLSQQEALCDGDDTSCIDVEKSNEVCKLSIAVGHCRGYEERWLFEPSRATCEPFGYTGCGGNGNNFRTREHCLRVCRGNHTAHNATATTSNVSTTPSDVIIKKLKPTPPVENNEVLQNDEPAHEGGKCEMGPWLGWSECFGECGNGVKLNYRLVKNKSFKSGNECKKLVKSRSCKPAHCRRLLKATTSPDIN